MRIKLWIVTVGQYYLNVRRFVQNNVRVAYNEVIIKTNELSWVAYSSGTRSNSRPIGLSSNQLSNHNISPADDITLLATCQYTRGDTVQASGFKMTNEATWV